MATDPRMADLQTLRRRLCMEPEPLDGAGAPAAPDDAAALLATLRTDGSWPDVDYADGNLKDWAAATHLARLLALARAWYQPHPTLHGQPDALAAVLRGLDFWFLRNPQNPNWWWNQIGAPSSLGDVLLCVKDACDPSYIARAAPAFTCHEPAERFTGQNLVWVAAIQLRHGLLTDEPARVARALALVQRELRTNPDGEGLQPDMSFHQHGKLLYSGGYGQGFAADVGRLIALVDGTAYAWPTPLVNRFAGYLLDGCAWMVRGRTFEPGACGREITRRGQDTQRFRAGLHHLASFPHARQAEARAAAAIAPGAGLSLVTGNRCFWNSDLMVHHRPGYYLSVRMTSPRLVNADWPCCGGEGRLCHHMADGATFIMRDGEEYRDLYPVWNWRRIPGTTVVQDGGALDPDRLRGPGERPFAGGASDGQVGCAAMDFSRGGLTARKAWFLFDGGLVALGAAIRAEAAVPVRTTLNQCRWRGPAFLDHDPLPLAAGEYCLAPGMTFRHDGVAYHILDGHGTLRLGPQSGAWSDCGVGVPDPLTLGVLDAGINHGVRPAGATYTYAVIPDRGQPAAASPLDCVVVCNEPARQAVWDTEALRGHVVFYEPGNVEFPDGQRIGVDQPCILLYRPLPDRSVELTLAQPEQREGLLSLNLEGLLQGTLAVSLPRHPCAGSSQTVIWHPSPATRGQTPRRPHRSA